MARVRLLDRDGVREDYRSLFERIEQGAGILNIYRALFHSPEALRRFMRFGSYLLTEGKLAPRLREIAILRAGGVCRSPYEVSQHVAFGRSAGLTDDEIRAAVEGRGEPLGEQGAAVLRFASELSERSQVSDSTFAGVAAFLDDEQLVELTLVVGFYNMVSRTLNGLQVDLDETARRDLEALAVAL
jgi:4-carboxymuconolactone decarboxylase